MPWVTPSIANLAIITHVAMGFSAEKFPTIVRLPPLEETKVHHNYIWIFKNYIWISWNKVWFILGFKLRNIDRNISKNCLNPAQISNPSQLYVKIWGVHLKDNSQILCLRLFPPTGFHYLYLKRNSFVPKFWQKFQIRKLTWQKFSDVLCHCKVSEWNLKNNALLFLVKSDSKKLSRRTTFLFSTFVLK